MASEKPRRSHFKSETEGTHEGLEQKELFDISRCCSGGFDIFCIGSTRRLNQRSDSFSVAADAAAMRAILDRQVETWNRHDMKAYVADMTPDINWINVVGMW